MDEIYTKSNTHIVNAEIADKHDEDKNYVGSYSVEVGEEVSNARSAANKLDILSHSPLELVYMVFDELSIPDLNRCSEVSHCWRILSEEKTKKLNEEVDNLRKLLEDNSQQILDYGPDLSESEGVKDPDRELIGGIVDRLKREPRCKELVLLSMRRCREVSEQPHLSAEAVVIPKAIIVSAIKLLKLARFNLRGSNLR